MEAKLNLFDVPGASPQATPILAFNGMNRLAGRPQTGLLLPVLNAYGLRADALRIAQHFAATVDAGFASDGAIREKYNVVAANSNVKVSAGYTTNEIGFGWTNAVYLEMNEVIQKQAPAGTN